MHQNNLVQKYNVPVPRYTSYPPVPAWNHDLFSANTYVKSLKSLTSQHISLYIHLPYCESLCTYCGCNTRITVNHSVEKPYIDALLQEFGMYVNALGTKPIVEELHIGGGTPTFFSVDNLSYLLNGLKELSVFSAGGDFSFEGHPNNTTFGHLKLFREHGFNRVSFGVQDFDDKVQESINRIQPFENVKRVMDWARYFNYKSVNVDLVYGLPFQTTEGLETTLDYVLQLNPDRIAFYGYAHVPWTKKGQRKFTEKDIPADAYKAELFEKGKNTFLANGYTLFGFDHFAKPSDDLALAFDAKRLHRNFMGYTTSKTNCLIGLGVSAIGETLFGYAQNEKTVEQYLKHINNHELPIVKGHLHTNRDLVVKKIIADLMCNFTCNIELLLPFMSLEEIKNKLQIFMHDELVSFNGHTILIHESGRKFVRNICAAIDPLFVSQENLYSLAV